MAFEFNLDYVKTDTRAKVIAAEAAVGLLGGRGHGGRGNGGRGHGGHGHCGIFFRGEYFSEVNLFQR